MPIIENFAELSEEALHEFAENLIEKINDESTFSSQVNFEVTSVAANDLDGGLWIEVSHNDSIEVPRAATWSCIDEDEAYSDPGYDADYADSLYEDVKSAFETLEAVVDGYKVSLEIDDVDEDETIEVEVDDIEHKDDGIGHYEYWGEPGYDSQPYIEVEGAIIKACSCALTFFVEPADAVPEEAEEN